MNKKSFSICLLAMIALPMSAQVDKAIEKIKEKADKVIDKGSDLIDRGKNYVEDKADKVITRYGLDTIDVNRVDQEMAKRYMKKGSYDEDYLERPEQRFTLKILGNFSGSGINIHSNREGMNLSNHLTTKNKITTSVGFSYRGIGLSLSVNPFKWSGKNANTEWNFNVYNNKYGFDLVYQNARDFDGWIEQRGVRMDIDGSQAQSKLLIVNGYYAFNNRRYSYPAAFSQSYRQLRSQGSWLLAASLMVGNVRVHEDADIGNPYFRVSMGKLAFGGGYGYNWVITPKWMVHASALPTLVVGSFGHLTVNDERERVPYAFPEFIMTERVAAIYELTQNHFFALNFVAFNTLLGSRKSVRVNYNKWRIRICYGFRF